MFHRFLRYGSALLLLMYGFAKINGSQFTILDSELDKPMGQVSGFWLTWYYFGYSHFYAVMLGLVEITGALLLTFRRTTLLGVCILAPMLANIVIIDLVYRVDPGGTLSAILLLIAMLILLAPYVRELVAFFVGPQREVEQSVPATYARWGVRLAMVVTTCGFTYWVANVNNRAPTPLDGVWDVAQADPPHSASEFPKTLFFEFNRASWATFKSADGVYQDHHFDVDPAGRRLQIWENWEGKGEQILDSTYTLSGPDLTVRGNWRNLGTATIRLHKRSVR